MNRVAAFALGLGLSAAAAQTAPLTGAAAWQALVGNTIVVGPRAGNYTEYFRPDGSLLHLDQDGRTTGKWTQQDGKVCFDYPEDDDRVCTDLEVDGTKGAFVSPDGSREAFDILTGNAKNL